VLIFSLGFVLLLGKNQSAMKPRGFSFEAKSLLQCTNQCQQLVDKKCGAAQSPQFMNCEKKNHFTHLDHCDVNVIDIL
jgi:hypothetical protein